MNGAIEKGCGNSGRLEAYSFGRGKIGNELN